MSLRDHFHPPLSTRRHWHAFHNAWATYLSADLNRQLPAGYFAEPNVQFGIEIDVAAFDEDGVGPTPPSLSWSPPMPTLTVPAALGTDSVEVLVYHSEGGPLLAGAIELISPANKDRPAHRDTFLSKCVAYLNQSAGLVVVDVVTSRTANLHDELLSRVASAGSSPLGGNLYAAAYRPANRAGEFWLDVWQETLSMGQPLPTMPLWLRGGLSIAAQLDATYNRTCEELRVSVNGA